MVRTKKTWRIGGAAIFATGITLASRFDLAISSALSGLTTDGGTFKLSVPKDTPNCGGLTLFGQSFGDYSQDICIKAYYEDEN